MRQIKNFEQFTLRVPPELLETIRQRAAILNRSVSAEVQTLIEAALESEVQRDRSIGQRSP